MIGGIRTKLRKVYHNFAHERTVLSKIQPQKNIFYFGVPMHSNLGDLAQYICICDWIKKNYPDYNVVEIDSKVFMDSHSRLRYKLRNKIKKGDLILFQSGYCTQDLGGVEDLMHQAVMQDYPDNHLLMMPQTVFFESSARKKQASTIYDAHQHLLFLARDQVSFKMAQEMFPHRKVYAFPDIVTTMIGKYHFSEKRSGILLCTRNDGEKYYSNNEIEKLAKELQKFDAVEQTDTTVPESLNANTPHLREFVESYIKNFAQYRLIITDRYHGTIFSLIAQTPVIVLKTTDHKVRTGVDWFKGVYDQGVAYAETLDDALALAENFLSKNFHPNNEPYFEKNYYDRLKGLFEASTGDTDGNM